ncbi:M20/M25/M40 family metallo-hydrolase [Pelosinus propionicus]|uniref:Peptidase T-like protein n=1 Tax=Pelosinus propionicus DSM 13327 TaxID=1123291 RepID=A0A1I4LYA8_9FIRM|nr:M20/M25/M40 family metallo-hydrolase [Pelosinus propionicus]SFL95934.1 peptidase T-like protein [Pelosinus propionicus DSM 13327]
MINKERVLTEFFELVRIKCSTREEREVADVLKTRLAELGLEVTEDQVGEVIGGNCGNVIAYKPGSVQEAPTLMLSAHMDCVEPCGGIEPQLKDGVITSVGDTILGADDKAGVVAILEALRIVNEENIPHGPIQVVFTVAEEGGLNGAKAIDPTALKADFGYALDSGGTPGEIITMAPGQNSITALIHGRKAHAGVAPEEGINAIVVAGKALAQMKIGRIDFETTSNAGIISGGIATNIVPDLVEVKCEARSRNMEKLEVQTLHMKETFEQVAAANGAQAEVKVATAYGPYVLSEKDPVVTLAVKAAESISLIPEIKATGGGSDANFFNNYGVPTAVLGVGMSKVHTKDEYIKEIDLYNSAELVTALIKTAANMKK